MSTTCLFKQSIFQAVLIAHVVKAWGPCSTGSQNLLEMLSGPLWLIPLRKDPLLSSEQLSLASSMKSACLATLQSLQTLDSLSQQVLKTILEVSAPFTRHLYSHKWRAFEGP